MTNSEIVAQKGEDPIYGWEKKMETTPIFEGFAKIPRLSRPCIATEKIDGTNAQVMIWDEEYRPKNKDGTPGEPVGRRPDNVPWTSVSGVDTRFSIVAGSKSRWITPTSDNHGFSKWVHQNVFSLCDLGYGRHFGEWWGQAIQRGYGLKEKRFSLFNVTRWGNDLVRPTCCHVVPVIAKGMFWELDLDRILANLSRYGSYAAPGFMKPEGIVVYHVQGNFFVKKTIEHDEQPKGGEKIK